MTLQACLNGRRNPGAHDRLPLTAGDLAADAAAAVSAGATSIHVHPRSPDGRQTIDHRFVGATVEALRTAVTAPIGVTTGRWIEPDTAKRHERIREWWALPDFASVNFDETGATELAASLLQRGVGIEAGLPTAQAAEQLLRSGLTTRCRRILLEPTENTVEAAQRTVHEIEARLEGVATSVPRLLHGDDHVAWPMLDLAIRRGYEARIGLEDTLGMPDGSRAAGNEDLVREACRRRRRFVGADG